MESLVLVGIVDILAALFDQCNSNHDTFSKHKNDQQNDHQHNSRTDASVKPKFRICHQCVEP